MKAPHPDQHLKHDNDLLQQARCLDEAGLGAIFNAHYQPIYYYLAAHLGHGPTAEDLAADVFRVFLEQVGRGKGPTRRLKPWLYRVAHNLMVDELRRRKHREHEPLDEDLPARDAGIGDQVEAMEEHSTVRAALCRLPVKQQVVLVMKYVQGMEYEEIARILQVKEGAVRALQFRGLRAIGRYLEGSVSPRKETDNG